MIGRVDRRHLATALGSMVPIGLISLLPDFDARGRDGNQGVEAFRGRIEAMGLRPREPGSSTPSIPQARVRALDGPREGDLLAAFVSGPGGSQTVADYRVGQEVVVTITAGPAGTEPFVAVSDRWRTPALQALGLAFAAAVGLVGGWHGIARSWRWR